VVTATIISIISMSLVCVLNLNFGFKWQFPWNISMIFVKLLLEHSIYSEILIASINKYLKIMTLIIIDSLISRYTVSVFVK